MLSWMAASLPTSSPPTFLLLESGIQISQKASLDIGFDLELILRIFAAGSEFSFGLVASTSSILMFLDLDLSCKKVPSWLQTGFFFTLNS